VVLPPESLWREGGELKSENWTSCATFEARKRHLIEPTQDLLIEVPSEKSCKANLTADS
jgi:hypothetical protein